MQRLLFPEEVAEILGVKKDTLKQWRCNDKTNRRLNFIKLRGKGDVRYRVNDVEDFIERCSYENLRKSKIVQ